MAHNLPPKVPPFQFPPPTFGRAPLNTFAALKPIKPSTPEQTSIIQNQSISQPARIITSEFLTRDVLLSRLKTILRGEPNEQPLLLGAGVAEIVSAAAYEMLWRVVRVVGQAAESRVTPGEGLKVHFEDTATDRLRERLAVTEPKRERDGRALERRVIRVLMRDVYRSRRVVPQRWLRRYEIRKLLAAHGKTDARQA